MSRNYSPSWIQCGFRSLTFPSAISDVSISMSNVRESILLPLGVVFVDCHTFNKDLLEQLLPLLSRNTNFTKGFVTQNLQCETDVKRLPDLGGIHQLAEISASLPALRRLHILTVLKGFLESVNDLCTCSIAATGFCFCGQCCHYPDRLQLPFYQIQPMLGTHAAL